MWTEADKKFLRSLRVQVDRPLAPLPPLPRFRVLPIAIKGWYRVIDAQRRSKPVCDFGPENFPDPRLAAEDYARQLNEAER